MRLSPCACDGERCLRGLRLVRLSGIDLIDRDQGQSQVADSPEQAMQRGLIDDRAG